MSDIIKPADLIELTGASQPAKQCDVLRRNGIRFTLRADGRPSLTWEAYNRQLASNAGVPEHKGPNLAAV